jgi:hypothetical protein
MNLATNPPASDHARYRILISPDHPAKQFRIELRRQRRRADHIDEHHGHLPPLGIAGARFRRGGRCAGEGSLIGGSRLGVARGDRFQKPAAIAERQTQLLEIAVIELAQDIQVDIVRLKRGRVLFQIIRTQPLAKIAHAVGSQKRIAPL